MEKGHLIFFFYSYLKGCFEKLEHEFMDNLAYIAGTAIGLTVIMVSLRFKRERERAVILIDASNNFSSNNFFLFFTVPLYCTQDGILLWVISVAQICISLLSYQYISMVTWLHEVLLVISFIWQILGMICSCILFCRSKEVRYEALGGQYSGLRV